MVVTTQYDKQELRNAYEHLSHTERRTVQRGGALVTYEKAHPFLPAWFKHPKRKYAGLTYKQAGEEGCLVVTPKLAFQPDGTGHSEEAIAPFVHHIREVNAGGDSEDWSTSCSFRGKSPVSRW